MRIIATAIVAAVAASLPGAALGAPARTLDYRITITNLSRADLTPPVWGVHNRRSALFARGAYASRGIGLLAEDGDPSVALSEFRGRPGVRRVAVAGRIPPGRSITLRVRTTTRHLRFSFAAMQVCSNDTFAGVSRLPLPLTETRRVLAVRAWDAGTERNTESAAHVPCLGAHNVGPDERRRIARDPTIRGIADLSKARQGWDTAIARLVVRRVR